MFSDDRFAEIKRRNLLVYTGHDDEVSRVLSAACDVRVVWGGDATVNHFRQFPLAPHGRDITFPDRHSFSILSCEAVARASDEDVDTLADRFYSDAFWFDQAACSSPRLIIWHRASSADASAARERFRAAVQAAVDRRGYVAEIGSAVDKMVLGFERVALGTASRYERSSNELTWIEAPDLAGYSRDHCGGGLFTEYVSDDLDSDLLSFVSQRDQTAACYGLDASTVGRLARTLNGRGVDRWVEIGRALRFSSTWDGYDLLQEFVKRVVVDV